MSKSVSLHPLTFEEALSSLISVKPEPKAKGRKKAAQKAKAARRKGKRRKS